MFCVLAFLGFDSPPVRAAGERVGRWAGTVADVIMSSSLVVGTVVRAHTSDGGWPHWWPVAGGMHASSVISI